MAQLSEYVEQRELLGNLVLRELRSRYKKSVLGWTWSLLNPVASVVVYTVVFGVFLKIDPPIGNPSGLDSFVIFLLCALIPWNFFANSVSTSIEVLVGNANLIKKVYFPRELLIASTIGALGVTFLIELGVLCVLLLIVGNMVIWWIPVMLVLVLLEGVFVLGIGLVLGVTNVYFRDVRHFVGIALQVLFYSAPIVYPLTLVPKNKEVLGVDVPVRDIYMLNPLVQIVEAFRDVLYDLRFPSVGTMLYLIAWAVGMLAFGLWVFSKLDRRLAEGSVSHRVAVEVEHVSKRYRLYHERNQSLKASVMRGRRARYDEFLALDDVSFEVREGTTFGLIGENGSGKSTMLKCIAKILRPDGGTITSNGKISALLELGAGFHQELSGRENVYLNGAILGLSRKQLDAKFDEIVDFSGIEQFIDSPVKNYSSGMYVRLGFSVAINVDPDILLIDEVLAVGDAEFQRKCTEKIAEFREQGRSIVVVSHSLPSVRVLCDEVALLEHGKVLQVGPAADVIDEYLADVFADAEDREGGHVRWGSKEVRIDKVELLDGVGAPASKHRTGDDVTIRFHYTVNEPVPNPVFGLAVHTVEGVHVTGTNTRVAELTCDPPLGPGTVDFRVPRLLLVPGVYDLTAVVYDHTCSHPYDHVERMLRFDVEAGMPRDNEGVVSLGGSWEGAALRPAELFRETRATGAGVARVIVATGEVLGASMAGPAIRALHIARALAAEHDVVLASTRECTLATDDIDAVAVDAAELSRLAQDADVLVVQGDLLDTVDPGSTVVVVDLYDPFHLEALEQTAALPPDLRHRALWAARRAIDTQVRRGDLFLCASNRQRDFWLGHLAAAGRINERTYADSPNLDRLITVVPFGVEDEPPWPGAPSLRDVVPGIGGDDLVLLWAGGIYDWFDPITLLHAVDVVRRQEPRVRLFFAGARHPNPDVGETAMAREARAVSDRLGLTGRHVFFHDWVEYDQRARYLMEADVGVSTHVEHVETAFSFRTRILDYLWASLPVVTTTGDDLGTTIDARGAGIAVPAGDVEALEAALLALLTDADRRAACASDSGALAREYRWSAVLRPLVEFCRSPRRAPDLVDPVLGPELGSGTPAEPGGDTRAAAGRALEHLRHGEISELLDKARNRFRR